MKYGDIVKFKGELGEVVVENDKFYFHPVNYGCYSCSNLTEIIDSDLDPITEGEKVCFLELEFSWGSVVKTHCIGDYQILEHRNKFLYKDKTSFHAYINFKDTNCSYSSLDEALIGAIAQNNLEVNEARYATRFILKMLGMERG